MTTSQRHTIAALLEQLDKMATELVAAPANALAKAQAGTNNGDYPHCAYRLGALEFHALSKGEALRRLIDHARDDLGLRGTASQGEAVQP